MSSAKNQAALRTQQIHRDGRLSLGMVYPSIEYQKDGSVSVRRFFNRPKCGGFCQNSVPQMRRTGVNLAVMSFGINETKRFPGPAGFELFVRVLDALNEACDTHGVVEVVRTKRDLLKARRSKHFGAILHATGAPINGNLANLRTLFRLGVRAMHPFHDDPSLGGDSDFHPRLGLESFGKQVIDEMQRLGMLIDLSHASDLVTKQVLRRVKGPVFDSHTACRKLINVARNRTDDQLRAIADTGGVVGIHFGSHFLEDISEQQKALGMERLCAQSRIKLKKMERDYKDPWDFMVHRYDASQWSIAEGGSDDDGWRPAQASLDSLVNHIEHMAEVMGINHVGLRADYFMGSAAKGLERVEGLRILTRSLLKRGFTVSEVRKIMGGNFHRFFKETLPS